MTYTINGKGYTEFDINKRCAEIMGKNLPDYQPARNLGYNIGNETFYIGYNPCTNPSDTDAIIDKVWDELIEPIFVTKDGFEWYQARWNLIMEKHNCSKLIAACICLIELEDEK